MFKSILDNLARHCIYPYRVYLTTMVTVSVLVIGFVGCGKEKLWVSPIGPETSRPTRAAKPALIGADILPKDEALVYGQITQNDRHFRLLPQVSKVTYAFKVSQAISGLANPPSFSADMRNDGSVAVRIMGKRGRNINGYYRAELTEEIADPATGAILSKRIIGQWASIPINGGEIYHFELPIGGQATLINDSPTLSVPIFKIRLVVSTPPSTKLKMGVTDQLVTVIGVINLSERDMLLNGGLGLKLDGDIPLKGVLKATVWDGAVKIGEYVFPYGRYSMGWFFQPLWVAGSSIKILAVKVDLAPASSVTAPDFNNRTLAVNVIHADGEDYMRAPEHTVIAE